MAKSYRMTYRTLRNYLLSQPRGATVGVSRHDCNCPVANAYATMLPKDMIVSVDKENAMFFSSTGNTPQTQPNPKFVKRFISKVDELPTEGNNFTRPVTREEALEILEGVYGTRNIYRDVRR